MKVLPRTTNEAWYWILVGLLCQVFNWLRPAPIVGIFGGLLIAVGVVTGLVMWSKSLPTGTGH